MNYRYGTDGGSLMDWVRGQNILGGKINVNKDTALGLSALLNCHIVISRDISRLPISVYKDTNKGKQKQSTHPIHRLLHGQPNELMTAQTWKQLQLWRLLKEGNSINIIERNTGDMRPVGLWPIASGDIKKIAISKNGRRIIYETTYGNFDQEDILHFKFLSEDGISGKSVISYQMSALGLGLGSQKYAVDFYEKGAHYDVVVTHPGKLSDEAKTRIRKGVDASREQEIVNGELKRTMLLEEGMKIEKLSFSPEEAQFIASQNFTARRIAGLYRVPPAFLGDLEFTNHSIDENSTLNYVKFCLASYIVAMEEELNAKLFRESEKYSLYTKFNVEALLRGDTKTRFESYQKGFNVGLYSTNDIAEMEDMQHVEGGDQHFVMANNLMPMDKMPAYADAIINKSLTAKDNNNDTGSK